MSVSTRAVTQNSNFVRALPYPALEEGNLSYPQGQYEVSIEPGEDINSVVLEHSISKADFISKALEEKLARYGCLVVVPITGYRKLHLSKDARHCVSWDLEIVGESPMLRPLVVAVTEISSTLTSVDEVDDAWQDIPIEIPKGARLATGNYFRSESSLNQMLKIKHLAEMPEGTFRVQDCTNNGFYFEALVATDLYEFLQAPGEYIRHRNSIYTDIVGHCFEILVRDYQKIDSEDIGLSAFSNLRALENELINNNLPTWHDDDFRSYKVALHYHPHKPSDTESNQDDDS